jgi:hypothetical protein
MHDELDKMQQALNRSYTDRDKIATDIEKLRDDLERSQVIFSHRYISTSILSIIVKFTDDFL